jgi:hypothetical protein
MFSDFLPGRAWLIRSATKMKTFTMKNSCQPNRVNRVGIIFWVIMLIMTCWMSFVQTRSSYPVNAVPGIFVSLCGLTNSSRPLVRSEGAKKLLTAIAVVFAVVAIGVAVFNIAKHP